MTKTEAAEVVTYARLKLDFPDLNVRYNPSDDGSEADELLQAIDSMDRFSLVQLIARAA